MRRRLHLVTGLILFTYAVTHLLNHMLGLWSLAALDAGRDLFILLWRNLPATVALYGAAAIHLGSALWSLYRRRSLRMPAWEATQILFGLSIPPLLTMHVLGTRFAHDILGVNDNYTYVLLILFVLDPLTGIKQALALIVIWVHGCIGLHFWLRLRAWYRRGVPVAYAAALLIPTLALAGVWVAGRQVARMAEDRAWLDAAMARLNFVDPEGVGLLDGMETAILVGLAGLLAAVFVARWVRARLQRRGILYIVYPDGRRVPIVAGTTVLEASRGAGIPHASVCGGRGRCSTCRVRVGAGAEHLPSPSEDEARVLLRVGAAPNVRLACQIRPVADLEVTPLLPPTMTPGALGGRSMQGDEREVAILFADLRDFTALAENRLPYDVVFVLNRYFAAMGMAVEDAGGRLDKFIGDGVMALFGIERGVEVGCRNALLAARRMAERLAELNESLAHELDRPLRIGIGIHSGPAIVGEMGYGRATSVTAIGDAVNTASRLEAMTKDFDVQLVLSAPVARHAGLDLSAFPRREIELRGRAGTMQVYVVRDAASLPSAPAPALV